MYKCTLCTHGRGCCCRRRDAHSHNKSLIVIIWSIKREQFVAPRRRPTIDNSTTFVYTRFELCEHMAHGEKLDSHGTVAPRRAQSINTHTGTHNSKPANDNIICCTVHMYILVRLLVTAARCWQRAFLSIRTKRTQTCTHTHSRAKSVRPFWYPLALTGCWLCSRDHPVIDLNGVIHTHTHTERVFVHMY